MDSQDDRKTGFLKNKLVDLILYIPVNNFSVMSRQVFLG